MNKMHLQIYAFCVMFSFAFTQAVLAAAPVTLTDQGTTVVLSNGLASVKVQKTDGKATSITSSALPSLNLIDSSYGYFFRTTGSSGGTSVGLYLTDGPGAVYTVVTNTAQMVDIQIRNPVAGYNATTYPNGVWDISLHYVMRAGDSGFYNYWVWRHNASQPAAQYGEDEWPARLNIDQFSYAAWDFCGPQKMGRSYPFSGTTATTYLTPGIIQLDPETQKLPVPNFWTSPTGQTDASGLPIFTQPTGLSSDHFPTWTKKDWDTFMGPYTSYRSAWGVANDQVGIWHLVPSLEWANGGPTKVKGGVSGNYMYMNSSDSHCLGTGIDNPGVAAGQVFTKICGPFFTYVNTGTDHMALWQDAQAKGQLEAAKWPYTWVNESESDYPRHRGSVIGTLIAATGQSTANAVVILSSPPSAGWTGPDGSWTGVGSQWPGQGAWMFAGTLDYQFWTTADANGNFTIPAVRPGSYTLYSYVPGIFGEYKMTNVTITADQATNLGVLTWDPPRQQQLVWQIGTPDHSTSEFRFGDRMWQWGLWWRYMEEMGTSDLNYTVGQSTPASNWYYGQSLVPVAGGTYFAPKWNINFSLPAALPNPVVLTVDLAGSYGTSFYTYVNGVNVTPAPNNYAGQPTVKGDDIYRDAVQVGRWQHFALTLPSSAFKVGSNTLAITIRQPGFSGTWTGTPMPDILSGGIMYDAVKLEAGPQIATIGGTVTLPNRTNMASPLTFTLTPTGTTSGSVTTQTITPATDGSFSLTNIPVGTYILGIKGAQWLKKDIAVNTLTGSATGLTAALVAGDLNGDNQIAGADLAMVRAAYGSVAANGSTPASPNWNPLCDLNGDGSVSATDLLMVRANYGKLGDP